MFTIIFIILFILTIGFITLTIKDVISKYLISIVTIFWFGILIVSSFNPYGLSEVKAFTYMLMIINILSFVLGCSLIKITDYKSKSKFRIDSIFSSKIFMLILIVAIAIAGVMYQAQRVLLADVENLGYIRANFFELIFEGNLLLLIIYYFLLNPIYHISLVIFPYLIFFNRKLKYLIPIMAYIGLFSLIGGGRASFVIILLYFVFGQIVRKLISVNDDLKIRKIPKFGYVILFTTMILAASIITSKRGGENDTNLKGVKEGIVLFGEHFVVYTVGPIRACDYALSNRFIEDNISDNLFYGLATFSGVDYLLDLVTKRIGVNYASTHEKTRTFLQNTDVPIGNNIRINYSFTNVLYHYLDFGVFGVLLFPLLIGLFFRSVIKSIYKSPSVQKLIILGFSFFILMQTPFTSYLNKLYTVPFFMILFIIDNFKKYKWRIR